MPMHCLFVDVRPICDVIINGLHTWGICSAPMFNEQCMKIIFGQYLQGCNGFVYKAHSKVPWFSLFFHFIPSPAVTAYFNVVGSTRFQCLKDCLGAKISVVNISLVLKMSGPGKVTFYLFQPQLHYVGLIIQQHLEIWAKVKNISLNLIFDTN